MINLAILIIILLLIHHRFIHRNEAGFSELDKWFQWSDINNHETVILLLLGIIIGLQF